MSLHRLRMGSKPLIAGHAFFGTFMIVMLPSYYFCYRRREHQENVIEMKGQLEGSIEAFQQDIGAAIRSPSARCLLIVDENC